jgi:putative membrane protein insertion efficiency factor
LKLLKAWQWTRRFRQPACRFYPSCSEYTRQAIEKHGLAAGMRLGVVRICKCHPFHDGGVDEVPEVLYARQIVMKTGLNPVLAGTKGKISTK